jgi:hypothetical protein
MPYDPRDPDDLQEQLRKARDERDQLAEACRELMNSLRGLPTIPAAYFRADKLLTKLKYY